MGTLEEITELCGEVYNNAAREWKGQGGKVAGFFCSYIPEELLHAAGIFPYRIRPVGCRSTSEADVFMSAYNCTFVKSCLEYALKGEYKFLDGLISMNSCDHIRRLYDIWKEKVGAPYMHFLSVPHKVSDEAVHWFTDEIASLRSGLEAALGIRITDEKLRGSIDVYNESRALLEELYGLRERDEPPISGSEAQKVLLTATAMPKEDFNLLMRRLLKELEGRDGISDYRARLMIAGSAYDDLEFTEILEGAGGLVVTDGVCFGSRYYMVPVEVNGNLLSCLARAYLNRPACSRMAGQIPRTYAFIREMIERFNVDGVIYQRMRHCDLWGGESMYINKKLEEESIPVLTIEREYHLSGAGQVKNRVEAFLEMIER